MEYKIEWTHIGDGKNISKLVRKSENQLKNIKFTFLGNLKNNEVIEYYTSNSVDLFLNVSSTEGLPVSIMEAISFGIPIVATNVGGTSEIVIEDFTGKLLNKDFENIELADIIEKIIQWRANNKYITMRKNCREYWKKNFEAKQNYQSLYNYIDKEINDINSKEVI